MGDVTCLAPMLGDECTPSDRLRNGMCRKHYQRWKKYGDPRRVKSRPPSEVIFDPETGLKTCTGCGRPQPLDCFTKGNDRHGKKQSCKRCCSDALRKWRKDPVNRETHRRGNRNASLRRAYGMTYAEYVEMQLIQGGVCAICGHPPIGADLNVDHDHITGRVRQLLCGPCNRGLGQFFENPETLEAAARYLMRHREAGDNDHIRDGPVGLRLGPGPNGSRRDAA